MRVSERSTNCAEKILAWLTTQPGVVIPSSWVEAAAAEIEKERSESRRNAWIPGSEEMVLRPEERVCCLYTNSRRQVRAGRFIYHEAWGDEPAVFESDRGQDYDVQSILFHTYDPLS